MSNNTERAKPSEVQQVTLKSGAPVGDKLNSLLLGEKGPNLLADVAYLEETAHFNRERIPERVVHAKGMAAYGEFRVTSAKIAEFCRASMFASAGKVTPVAARFSHVTGESGIADTARDVRGFAVKFYSDTGIWDLVGNNLPVFFIRDPINFTSFIHSQKRNPKTHLRDPDAFWDFVTLRPESLHAIIMLFSERGTPDGFRHMHGYGVDTFKLVSSSGSASYAKFHWICGQGIKNMDQETSLKIAGLDPDYSLRDLQLSIARGHFPSWTLKFQIMSEEQTRQVSFNPFDVTKTWPQAQFPLIEVGEMKLNKVAENYFAQVEQLAFSPSNMVAGIEPSADKMLIGRMFSYPDAQRYRLGANYADLAINRPRCPVMTPTYCDGLNSTQHCAWSLPNYIPSSELSNLKMPNPDFLEHSCQFSGKQGRYDLSEDDNYSQPRELVSRVLKGDEFKKLCANLADHLAQVTKEETIDKVLSHLGKISSELAKSVKELLQSRNSS